MAKGLSMSGSWSIFSAFTIPMYVLYATMSPAVYALTGWTVETFPDPLTSPDHCDLNSPGLACDPNRLLERFNDTFSGAEYLSQLSQHIRSSTNCSCTDEDTPYGFCPAINSHGYTLLLVVMKSIRMNAGETDTESRLKAIRTFAEALRRRFHHGQCSDDILIAVAADQKAVWTAVGEAAERIITPEVVARVNQEAEPLFTKAEHLRGLTLMLDSYGKILLKGGQGDSATSIWSRGLRSWLVILFGLLTVVSMVVLVVLIILRFCCNEKRKYTVGSRSQD